MTSEPIRVVLAEDAELIRDGVAKLLRDHGFDVVAEVGDHPGLLAAVDALRPAIAVVDVRMPPTKTTEGLRAAVEIRRNLPDVAVLVLAHNREPAYLDVLLRGRPRAVGYVLKERVGTAGFVDAVRRVAAGGSVVDRTIVDLMMSSRGSALDKLSRRQRDVLALMAEGRSNSGISRQLDLAGKTVESHIRDIFRRLDLYDEKDDDRRVLAVLAYLRARHQGAP